MRRIFSPFLDDVLFLIVLALWSASSACCLFAEDKSEPKGLVRVPVNNPNADYYLAVGLWSWVVPADVDGDGNTDLIVSCEDVPYNGVWYFRNTGDNPLNPTFEPAKRLSRGVINVQPSWVDGKLRVLTPGNEYPNFLKTGVDEPVPLMSGKEKLPENVHFHKVRGNMWRFVDFDGDGKLDIVVGTDDWTDYGWDDAYDSNGVWQNAPLRGNLYLLRNIGTNEFPEYEKPTMLKDVNGDNLETFGWPNPNFADWDGDGDLDILGIEFRDTLQYSENVGSRTAPSYKQFEPVFLKDGSPAAAELAMPTIVAYDWNKDGYQDVLLGDEDGRVALFVNTGEFKERKPIFDYPFYFKQIPDSLKCGALSTPFGVDWDDDGDWDILCGNSAGYLFFFENMSGPGVDAPQWGTPVALGSEDNDSVLEAAKSLIPPQASLVEKRRDGAQVIRIMAGPNGSIQGPCEPKWGYTTLSVADWDGDGLKDVLVNSILGNVFWYKNVGKKGAPKLDQPRAVEVEWEGDAPKLAWGWRFPKGKELLTQWRTTPYAVDFNADGLTDLIMLDVEGYLAFFERYRDDNGELKLASPKHVLVDASGVPLRLNSSRAGGSGRRKICVVDYNNDGLLDILANGKNADLYLQIPSKDGLSRFVLVGEIDPLPIKGHSTSPTVVDFNNDGVLDPFIGAEDGHFYYKVNDFELLNKKLVQFDSNEITVESVLKPARLENGLKAFANRDYVWTDLIPEIEGRDYLQTLGGVVSDVVVRAKKDVNVQVLVGLSAPLVQSSSYGATVASKGLGAEKKIDVAARYSDSEKSPLTLFEKTLESGDVWTLPVETWTGTILLLPE